MLLQIIDAVIVLDGPLPLFVVKDELVLRTEPIFDDEEGLLEFIPERIEDKAQALRVDLPAQPMTANTDWSRP